MPRLARQDTIPACWKVELIALPWEPITKIGSSLITLIT